MLEQTTIEAKISFGSIYMGSSVVLGIRYLKVAPTTHVLQYRGGKLTRDGAGLSFFYFAPFSEIALIPLASTDSPFVFNEVTSDFQEIAVQGQLTYRTSDAKKLASVLDFSVQGQNRYRSDDPNKLSERLTNAAQILARSFIQKRSLKDLLGDADGLVLHVQASFWVVWQSWLWAKMGWWQTSRSMFTIRRLLL